MAQYKTFRERLDSPPIVVTHPVRVMITLNQVQEYDPISKRVLPRTEMKEYSPADNLKRFKVSDFYLENLRACGATSTLKLTMMHQSNLNNSARLQNQVEQFIASQPTDVEPDNVN